MRNLLACILLCLFLLGVQASVEETFLTGQLTASEILQLLPEYADKHQSYQVDRESLGAGYDWSGIEIMTVFGSWCSDSLDHVPPFIKIAEFLQIPEEQIIYIGVDKEKNDPEHMTDEYGIVKVPTFIVMKDGLEIGRIIETPTKTLEKDLFSILKK